ncbi:pentatricopeptide repeat-containing protein [Tanacetum coccineum]
MEDMSRRVRLYDPLFHSDATCLEASSYTEFQFLIAAFMMIHLVLSASGDNTVRSLGYDMFNCYCEVCRAYYVPFLFAPPLEGEILTKLLMNGRAGHFDEVVNQLRKMPIKPDARVWKALLRICRIHGNLELGTSYLFERLIELEPQSSIGYVFLTCIYASSWKWESVAKVRKNMNERDVRKDPGISWLENKNMYASYMYERDV